jgi:hypothetical protein
LTTPEQYQNQKALREIERQESRGPYRRQNFLRIKQNRHNRGDCEQNASGSEKAFYPSRFARTDWSAQPPEKPLFKES